MKEQELFIRLILLFVFLMLFSSINTHAQKVTLSYQNVPFEQVLNSIKKQTGFALVFSEQLVDINRKVSINVKEVEVENALKQLLSGTNLDFEINNKKLYLVEKKKTEGKPDHKSFVPDVKKTITGTIVDSRTGEPITGASVVEKGTTNGVITDLNGRYSLVISADAVLSISYMGYSGQEINTSGKTLVDISLLEDSKSLDEIVVIGYGIEKKENLTGAVDAISGEKLQNRFASNVGELIKGVSPNLNISMNTRGGEPGASPSWNIRGLGSINSSSNPLILIDGVEMNINDIDPSTIESISILKDAAASAIYGSRAPFGVILITTKKGNKDGKVNIEYNNNLSFSSPISIPSLIDALTWATAYNQASENAGLAAVYPEEQVNRIKEYMNGTFPYEYDPDNPISNIFQGRRNGNANYDWPHILFKDNVFNQTHNINIAGNSAKVDYYLSGGYLKQDGSYGYGYDYYERYNFLSNISSQITDWLKIRSSSKYSKGLFDYPLGMTTVGRDYFLQTVIYYAPMTPMYNIDGSIQNPLIRLLQDSGRDKIESNNYLLTVGADLEPLKNWVTSITYNHNVYSSRQFINPKPVWVKLGTGSYGNIGKASASYEANYHQTNYSLFNITSSYEKNIGNHYLKGLLGFEQEYRKHTGLMAQAAGISSIDVPSISTSLGAKTVDDAMSHWATRGVFGRLNYNYREIYLLELNARYNGTSRFASGKKWGFFPSASVGYFISKEDFWEPISPYMNSLKLRASYGTLGNQNIFGLYTFIPLISIYNETGWLIDGSRQPYATTPGLIRDDLTWETIATTNLGFDAAWLRNRLQLNFDWYERLNKNMLGPSETLPYPLGAQAPQSNNAELSTKGFEIILSWQDMISKDFSYNVKLSLGDSKTVINSYKNDNELIDTWYAGKNYGEIWGYTTDGIIQTADEKIPDQSKFYNRWLPGDIKYRDLDGNDTINDGTRTLKDHGDLRIIGNTSPRYNFGISAGFNWKGIDFNMFWQGIGKRDYLPDRVLTTFWGLGHAWGESGLYKNSLSLDYWRPADETNLLGPNTDSYFPKPYFSAETRKNRLPQTRYLLNAAYIRLKNIQLGYTLPTKWSRKILMQRARVYVSGENVLTFSGLPKNMDPETTVASASMPQAGFSGFIYPLSMTLSFGVNLNF